ncbi:MAG: Rieske 2Fe-2S domain-containing protein [Candidatus Poribacteria bacterium]|nr:Rieske 2Fe-2S domain-containing protein [Candidatus Poribacteria bacterium]
MSENRNETTRRRFLQSGAVLAILGWVGCGDGASPTDPDPTPTPPPIDPDPPTTGETPPGVEVKMSAQLKQVGGTQEVKDAAVLMELGTDNNGRGNETILLARVSEEEVAANTALCTHAQCVSAYNANRERLECPCHGSQFGLDGQVIVGPANRPLLNFKATIHEDSVFLEKA